MSSTDNVQQPDDWLDNVVWTRTLTSEEQALRQTFVEQYLLDFNPINAALRCGFASSVAGQYSAKLMQDNYVQWLIAQKKIVQPESKDDLLENKDLRKRKIISALYDEAFYHGHGASHAARVAALTKLARIEGIDKDIEEMDNNTPKGGVLLVPMAPVSRNQWEEIAAAQQENLTKDD